MPRAIVLVVVVVLVLDCAGVNRSARVTPAARFGRSLTLPPFDALSLAQGRP
jgi:hypothetical protein